MQKIEHEQRSILVGLLCAFAASWIYGMIVQVKPVPLRHVTTIFYAAIIIVWTFTVQERILDKKTRRFLMFGATCLALLFVLRVCRWDIFAYSQKADEYLRYTYYMVYIIVPLTSLCAALRVGKREDQRMPKLVTAFLCMAVLLCLLVMTNRLHFFLLKFQDSEPGATKTTHRFLYYIVAIWYITLTISAIIVLVHRCRLSASRKHWYIPAAVAGLSIVLMAVYYAVDGSPTAFGLKLYLSQELHMLLFIGMWESAFQIGLIPTNAGYSEMFANSTLGGIIINKSGEIVYESKNYMGDRTKKESSDIPNDYILCEAEIQGGRVCWMEDHSAINGLKENLKEALEQINTENTLLAFENEIKENHAVVETKNRIYDGIVHIVSPQLEKLKAALEVAKEGESDKETLANVAYLAAYIKRRSNLALIAEANSRAELSELYFAIRESLDYIGLSGVSCDVRMDKSVHVPVESLIAAYEFFENILEKIADTADAIMVNLAFDDGLNMNIMTDALIGPIPESLLQQLFDVGLCASQIREEDITYLTIKRASEGVNAS